MKQHIDTRAIDIRELQKLLGYSFTNPSLLQLALTHPSYALPEHPEDNQRLEFLGDAVLQFCVSHALFIRFPNMKEGSLTRRRAALVCEANLAELAKHLQIGKYVYLGYGEEVLGGRNNPSILGDTMEAIIAAVWLDGGFSPAVDLVERLMIDFIPHIKKEKDAKSLLQEKLQSIGKKAPVYQLVSEEGPPHARIFTVNVYDENKRILGTGIGNRKQRAEEAAAAKALESIDHL